MFQLFILLDLILTALKCDPGKPLKLYMLCHRQKFMPSGLPEIEEVSARRSRCGSWIRSGQAPSPSGVGLRTQIHSLAQKNTFGATMLVRIQKCDFYFKIFCGSRDLWSVPARCGKCRVALFCAACVADRGSNTWRASAAPRARAGSPVICARARAHCVAWS